MRGAEGEATGDDLKLAALSGMDMPVVATPLAMPTSARGCHWHHMAQNQNPIVSLDAELQNLQLPSYVFLLV